MTISTANAAKLNKMNRAAQNVSLGTVLKGLDTAIRSSGSYTAIAADASASSVTIATGLTGVKGFIAQVYTSGSQKSSIKVINSGSNLTITAGSTVGSTIPAIALNDVVQWMVW